MNDPEGEHSGNVEGAPTMVYEVWYYMHPDGLGWVFIGYRVLTLNQVLRYLSFGYLVERNRACDRNGTLPLFPRLAATCPDPSEGLD
jgi:hypothetical protein